MTDTRGILHPHVGLDHFQLHRLPPVARLQPYVDRLWCVQWNLADGADFEQPVLAHPCVNVVVEQDRAALYGVPSRLSRQHLTGRGWAVAAMGRPGGARAFLDGPARDWVDRVVEIEDHWGPPGSDLVRAIRAVAGGSAAAESQRVQLLADFLESQVPPEVSPDSADAVAAAALIAADPELCRVEQLCSRTGIEVRSLQRLFAEHVGLSPKQVIRRYRLLQAAEEAAGGAPVVWADVAHRLGFSDQAHLTRDFTRAFGMSPGRYARG